MLAGYVILDIFMKEIELKILDINVRALSAKLRKLGAKKIGKDFLIAESFDFPNSLLHCRDFILRLRQEGNKTVLTFKGKSEDSRFFKSRREIETTVSDFTRTKNILLYLGMRVVKHHEKIRTSFVLKNLHFDIDEYPTIPPYLEIEGPPKKIKTIIKKLGYSLQQTTKMTATETLRYYGQNANNQRCNKSITQKIHYNR